MNWKQQEPEGKERYQVGGARPHPSPGAADRCIAATRHALTPVLANDGAGSQAMIETKL